MHKKHSHHQPIDNFFPSRGPINNPIKRPLTDRERFPDVGVTMSSYRGSLGSDATVGAVAENKTYRRGKKVKKKWSKKRRIITFIVAILALLFLWVGFKVSWNLTQIFGNPFSIFWSTRLRGEDQGRVNILLAGNSADDAGHHGADLTDSIMLFSLDTKNHKAFLLSIPRDLYVDIPGHGYSKINAAYYYGKNEHFKETGYPNGGMGLLNKTIYQTLGIRTYYYALVNYSALRDSVNAVGGITIKIHSDNPYGLYDPSIDWTTGGPLVRLSNGKHHLNGQQALDLARARGDAPGSYGYAQSDFTRTQYQREIIKALKDKATSTGVLANPVKLTSLFDAVGKNVDTDMSLGEARRLHDLMGEVADKDFKSYALNDLGGKNYLSNYTTVDGQSALVPSAGVGNYAEIRAAIARLMSSGQIGQEHSTAVVLNGTGITGLADKNKQILSQSSIKVLAIGNAKHSTAQTTIINVRGKLHPATLAYLERIYGQNVTTNNSYAGKYKKADFIVVLGSNAVAAAT